MRNQIACIFFAIVINLERASQTLSPTINKPANINRTVTNTPFHRRTQFFFLITLLAIGYGSLFPFHNWQLPDASGWPWFPPWPKHFPRIDIGINILVYIPFGAFLTWLLLKGKSSLQALCLTLLCAVLLSWSIELLQALNPTRASSMLDVMTNVIGALLGSSLALFIKHQSSHRQGLILWFDTHCRNQNSLYLGVITLFIWSMAESAPFIPSFDLNILQHGVSPFTTAEGALPVDWPSALYFTASMLILALITQQTLKLKSPLLFFNIFVLTILLLKIPIIGRQLHLEPLLALLFANLFLLFLRSAPSMRWLGLTLTLIALFTEGLKPFQLDLETNKLFNWDMLRAQILHPLGLVDILKQMWLIFAICFFINHHHIADTDRIRHQGAITIFLLFFAIEHAQTYLMGRYPDITDAVIPVLAWYIAVLIPRFRFQSD